LRGRKEAIPFFVRGLADTNAWVRHTAMVELKDVEQADLSAAEQKLILDRLTDSDERVRATSVYILGKWKVEGVQSLLTRALTDSDTRVRANAIETIRAHGLEQLMLKDLEPLLLDRNNRVRANVAMVLSRFNPAASLATAESMLNSTDPLTRSSAAWLIGSIRPEKGGTILLDVLKIEKDEIVINQLVRALAKLAKDQIPLHNQITQIFGS
jgi:HEAT repeat protein